MGRLDYLSDHFADRHFQQEVQSSLDMLLLEKMQENAIGRQLRPGRRYGAVSGRRTRDFCFWAMLAICIYYFILRPLGL